MASAISAIHGGNNASATSLSVSQSVVGALNLIPSNVTHGKASANIEDTVQLSDSAQQYIKASQSSAQQNRNIIEQLVQAAAAGDVAALSLLTIA
jgi:hypothetical protein